MGFIPDSMDQSKPLKLYQQDQTCILKATLSDSDPTPIFFEGIPQRYQINNTTSSNTNNDAYYLTFNSQIIPPTITIITIIKLLN